MAAVCTGSYYTSASNDTARGYAKAASDASYKYYNNMTWSWWSNHPPGSNKIMWSMWEDTASANRSWQFATQTDGSLRTIFSWNGTNFSLHKTATAVFDSSWKHYMVSFANGVQTVYINNVLQTMNETLAWGGGAAGLYAAGQQVLIGSTNPAAPVADSNPGGNFTNFSMWNVVLNSTQRTELYNLGRPSDLSLHSAYANCTNWWRADQSEVAPTTSITDAKNGAGSIMTITQSGSSGNFKPSASYPNVSTDPGVATVLLGQPYIINGETKTGTLATASVTDVAAAVWDRATASHSVAGSFGLLMQKLLTVSKFLGFK